MCQLRCRPPPTTVALQMQEHTTYELSSNAVQYKTCYAGSFLLKNKRQKAENLRKCQGRRLSVQAESQYGDTGGSLSDPFTARERRLLAPSSTITGSILGKMPNWDFAFTAVFSVLIHCCSFRLRLSNDILSGFHISCKGSKLKHTFSPTIRVPSVTWSDWSN